MRKNIKSDTETVGFTPEQNQEGTQWRFVLGVDNGQVVTNWHNRYHQAFSELYSNLPEKEGEK